MHFATNARGSIVRKTVLAAAVVAALTVAAADASAQTKGTASKADIEAVQAQMQALADRLGKLEAANAALQSENTELKAVVERRDAETDYLKAQTKDLRQEAAVANNDIAKVKGADWATRIKARGDFRFREEHIQSERVVGSGATAYVDNAANRDRTRIRARFGFDATVTDNVKATLLFATGGLDPRSSNQTLGTSGTRNALGVDMAYADWTALPGVNVVLGKQPWTTFRPGNSLFYDGDYNPEGAAVKFDRGMLFGTAYAWLLTENYDPNPAKVNYDSRVYGGQLGLKFPLLGGETRVAAHYYECVACENKSPLYNNSANGNTTYTVGTSPTNLLAYGYNIFELAAEMNTTVFNLPFQVWANYAENTASHVDYNQAYAGGVSLGKASNPKTWNAALWYQSIQKDALFGQFVDSDFADGKTDGEGFVLRGAYAPVKNFNIQATYFINTLNKDVAPVSGVSSGVPYNIGKGLNYDRLQVDLNYKF
jgi:hypothetical protein